MAGSRKDVIEAGRWLSRERAKRGRKCSTGLVARLATLYANRRGYDGRIHQQQLSDLENATESRGPGKLQPWWRYVREIFENGDVDAAAGAWAAPLTEADRVEPETLLIVTLGGERVGRIVWESRGPGREPMATTES
jgi:hypothetical protein